MQLPIDAVLLHRPQMKRAAFRFLNEDDFSALIELRDKADEYCNDNNIYMPSDDEAIAAILKKGIAIACFDDDRLIAVCLARRPGEEGSVYAERLERELRDSLKTLDVEDLIVDPDYRGNALQELMLMMLEAIAEEEGYLHMMATVSPTNSHSLNNFYRLRYRAECRDSFYGGLTRFIMNKDIGAAKKKRALLVVDYTFDFVADDGKLSCGKAGQDIEKAIVQLINDAAEQGEEIFVLNDIHHEGDTFHPENKIFPPHNIEGSSGRELYGGVKTAISDAKARCSERVHMMDKTRYSAFAGTPLGQALRERHIDEIVLCGVCTDICILHTAISAYNEGYQISIPRQAVASFDSDGHNYALKHFENVIGASVYDMRLDDESKQAF